VGARDRIVAATALSACRRVGTAKKRHFERIAGLEIVDVSLA
jgi:predicted nucleic acid-binding protein